MKYMSAVGFLAIVLCMPFVGSGQDKSTEAVNHFKKGVALFNENKKEEAVQEFSIAYETKPSWKIMYNIGQCHASLKRYGLAVESFEKYLGQGGDEVPKDRQDEVLSELDRLRRMVGSVKVHGPDGVEIYIDKILRGTTPMASSILTTAGVEHWIWLIKDGKKLLSVQETVSGSEVLELTVPVDENGAGVVVGPVGGAPAAGTDGTPPADSAATTAAGPIPETTSKDPAATADADDNDLTKDDSLQEAEKGGLKPVIFIATASAAVVFGGAAGGLAAAVNSKWESSVEKINDNPWNTDTEAVAANIHTLQILGYVSMGLAAASLIAAVTVIPFTNWKGKKDKKTAAVSAVPWADADGGGLLLEGRF